MDCTELSETEDQSYKEESTMADVFCKAMREQSQSQRQSGLASVRSLAL